MERRMEINDQLIVGAQPSGEQLQQLTQEGFKSIVNLRMPDEREQPLSPEKEGEKVRALGMQYVHIPVSMEAMRAEQVDWLRKELNRLPGPVFVHCHSGKRAGVFAMMHNAIEAGMSGEETLQQAEQMGFEWDVPELKEFVKSYIDRDRK